MNLFCVVYLAQALIQCCPNGLRAMTSCRGACGTCRFSQNQTYTRVFAGMLSNIWLYVQIWPTLDTCCWQLLAVWYHHVWNQVRGDWATGVIIGVITGVIIGVIIGVISAKCPARQLQKGTVTHARTRVHTHTNTHTNTHKHMHACTAGAPDWDGEPLPELSPDWENLMVACWAEEPTCRPSFRAIVLRLQVGALSPVNVPVALCSWVCADEGHVYTAGLRSLSVGPLSEPLCRVCKGVRCRSLSMVNVCVPFMVGLCEWKTYGNNWAEEPASRPSVRGINCVCRWVL